MNQQGERAIQDAIRRGAGRRMSPEEYEDLVRAVSGHQVNAVDADDVVRLVRLGQAASVEAAHSAGAFAGRSAEQLSPCSGTAADVSSAPPLELFNELRTRLEGQGIATVQTWATYVVCVLPAGGWIGWDRSLDLHALAMLGPERLAQPGPGPLVSAEWDAAAFRWLHERLYADQPPSDWVDEVARRREVRQAMAAVSLALVAQSVCEAALPEDFLDRLGRGGHDVAHTRSEIEEFWRRTAQMVPRVSEGWHERLAALDVGGRLRPGSVTASTLAGHLVGWALRQQIRVSYQFLRYVDAYAHGAPDVPASTDDPDAVNDLHRETVAWVAEEVGDPPLALDLALWAWRLDQAEAAGSLSRFLELRQQAVGS